MTSKRHAKPTAAALAERTYRKVLEFKRILLNQMAHIRLDIVSARREDREQLKTIVDHCARLLREKETLQKRLYAVQELKDEAKIPTLKPAKWEDFISGTCRFADEHKPNVRCLICGNLNISEDNYNQNWHKPDGEL